MSALPTLEIASLSAGGDGVARHDGLVVFVPRTAPGDAVEAEVRVEGRVGRGRLHRLVRPGPARVAPRCAHYEPPDRCGGCQWQHVAVDAQREEKRRIVQDAFARIGRRAVPLPPIRGGDAWRYRRTLTLALRRRTDGRWFAGLRAFDDPEAVFDLRECPLTEERVLAIWREVLGAAAHLPDVPRLRGTVRLLGETASFVLEGGRSWEALSRFLDAAPGLDAVWWQADGRRRRLVADRGAGQAPGASFAQVNAEVARVMHDVVLGRALALEPATAVDAYSGAGPLAAALAARGVAATAIELDEEAVAFAASRLPAPSRALAGRVEDLIDRALPADVVILNPPRAGVAARVMAALAASRPAPRALLYVSCDPATLARDVARLGAWRVHHLECFDMFPQTAHVETLCELRPEDGTA